MRRRKGRALDTFLIGAVVIGGVTAPARAYENFIVSALKPSGTGEVVKGFGRGGAISATP